MRYRVFCLVLFLALIVAFTRYLQVTVLYDDLGGLKPGDRVFLEGETVGKVQAIEVTPEGRFAVHLTVSQPFQQLTDQCRFVIEPDPDPSENRSVEIVCALKEGKPLANGAMIEGSSSLSLLVEQGARDLQAWSMQIQEEIKRWEKEMHRLPLEEWKKEIESQMEYWSRQIEGAGKEMRRHFRTKVLPHLEEAIRELGRRLSEQGKQKDFPPLDEKLESLRKA